MPQPAGWPGTPFVSRRMTLHRGDSEKQIPCGNDKQEKRQRQKQEAGDGQRQRQMDVSYWLWNLEGAEALEVEEAGGEALGGVLRAEDVAEEEAGGDGREVAGVAGYEVATAVPVVGEAVGSFGVDGVAEEGAVLEW